MVLFQVEPPLEALSRSPKRVKIVVDLLLPVPVIMK